MFVFRLATDCVQGSEHQTNPLRASYAQV